MSSVPPASVPAGADPASTSDTSAATGRPLGRNGRLTWLQLILGILFFIIIEFLAGLIAVIWGAVASGTVPTGPTAHLDPAGLLIGAIIAAVLAVGGQLLIVGPVGARPGLTLAGRGKLVEFALGLAIGTVLISVSTALIALFGGYRVTGFDPHPQLLAPLAIGILAAFVEETLFRGTLLRLLDGWLGSWAAIATSSVLFGLIHVTNPGAGWWGALVLIAEASILLGGAYLLTRRLWLAIGLHLAWNAVQSGVFSFPVSGTGEQHGILQAEMIGPRWLSGGEMGVEGSLVTMVVGLLAGIVMLVLAHRRGNLWPRERGSERAREVTPAQS